MFLSKGIDIIPRRVSNITSKLQLGESSLLIRSRYSVSTSLRYKQPDSLQGKSSRTQIRSFYTPKPQFGSSNYNRLFQKHVIGGGTYNEPPFQTKRLPFKTILILIASSSTITMILYVTLQLVQFQRDNETKRSIFLPLWINSNLLYPKSFKFPIGLKYLDEDFEEYMKTEMSQLNKSKSSDVENYLQKLQEENITYTVLDQLSRNVTIKQLFGLPMVVEDPTDFEIWVETSNPSVSGIQIDLQRNDLIRLEREKDTLIKSNETQSLHEGAMKLPVTQKDTSFRVSWKVKPINIGSIVSDFLIQAGLKLDRLEPPEALSPDPIHRTKAKFKNYDYDIVFTGNLVVKDNNHYEQGILSYRGKLDFDHLMINRGIKITDMDLSVISKVNPKEEKNYKIL